LAWTPLFHANFTPLVQRVAPMVQKTSKSTSV